MKSKSLPIPGGSEVRNGQGRQLIPSAKIMESANPAEEELAENFKDKRAMTWAEHRTIIKHEYHPERRAYNECCWHLGRSQTDVANLAAEDIDWTTGG